MRTASRLGSATPARSGSAASRWRRHRLLVAKHGLTIDDLLAADVVTADVTASREGEKEPDLFWAYVGVEATSGSLRASSSDSIRRIDRRRDDDAAATKT